MGVSLYEADDKGKAKLKEEVSTGSTGRRRQQATDTEASAVDIDIERLWALWRLAAHFGCTYPCVALRVFYASDARGVAGDTFCTFCTFCRGCECKYAPLRG